MEIHHEIPMKPTIFPGDLPPPNRAPWRRRRWRCPVPRRRCPRATRRRAAMDSSVAAPSAVVGWLRTLLILIYNNNVQITIKISVVIYRYVYRNYYRNQDFTMQYQCIVIYNICIQIDVLQKLLYCYTQCNISSNIVIYTIMAIYRQMYLEMYTYVVYITQDRTTDICIPWKKQK